MTGETEGGMMAKDKKTHGPWDRLRSWLFPKKEEEPPAVVVSVCVMGTDEAMEQLDELAGCFRKLDVELDRVIAKSAKAKAALDSIFECPGGEALRAELEAARSKIDDMRSDLMDD
jgi:hypothetical protein